MGTGLQGGNVPPDRHETVIYPTRLSRTVVRITDILRGGFTGQEVTVRGWIYRTRRVGGKGLWEAPRPIIKPVGSEGGSTLFSVEYFGRKAYLTQSWQLYAEALVLAMEKVYYIGPSFRAEKSPTTRHLTEYWHCEMEEAG